MLPELTVVIFRDVESTEYHNGFFATETTCRTVSGMNWVTESTMKCLASILNVLG